MKFSPEQLEVLRREFRLSPRETEIIDFLFQGVTTNQGLADRLGISVPGAKLHLRNVYLKTDSPDKATLLLRCFEALALFYGAEAFRAARREGPDEAGPPAK